MSTIADYLINDDYRPTISKPLLQLVDNYQIYDVFSTHTFHTGLHLADGNTDDAWLAVQAYSPIKIECDFNAIALAYPGGL